MRALLPALFLCAGAPAAAAQTVVIAETDCAALVSRHVPADDVAYKPGVDVDGAPVTPADLPDAQVVPPQAFAIRITVDIARRLGIDPGRFSAKADLGTVVWRDGAAWYNGRRLATDDAASLAAACREMLERRGR